MERHLAEHPVIVPILGTVAAVLGIVRGHRGALDLRRQLVQPLLALWQAGADQLHVAQDHGQQVVEVVRHTAGQAPDAVLQVRLTRRPSTAAAGVLAAARPRTRALRTGSQLPGPLADHLDRPGLLRSVNGALPAALARELQEQAWPALAIVPAVRDAGEDPGRSLPIGEAAG